MVGTFSSPSDISGLQRKNKIERQFRRNMLGQRAHLLNVIFRNQDKPYCSGPWKSLMLTYKASLITTETDVKVKTS